MTLILAWRTAAGVCCIADTRIGIGDDVATEAGPKILLVPIVLNKHSDRQSETRKTWLPAMGFAFAGSTLSAQAAHTMASTCLQNLVARGNHERPSVADVAEFYARCGAYVVNERRSRQALIGFEFAGIVFGRERQGAASEAFEVSITLDHEGRAVGKHERLALDDHAPMHLLGSGQAVAAEVVHELAKLGRVRPTDVLDRVISDPKISSVGGGLQAALATENGVILQPVFRPDGRGEVSWTVLGACLGDLGSVGRFSPTAGFMVV